MHKSVVCINIKDQKPQSLEAHGCQVKWQQEHHTTAGSEKAVTLTTLSEVNSWKVSFYGNEIKLKTWLSCDSHLFSSVPE